MMGELIQKIWPQWIPVEELGKGSYGTVYKAVRSDNNINSVSAIKVISIPQEHSEIEELFSEGMSEVETRTYFRGIVNDFVSEVSLMDAFKGMPNIVSIEDYAVVEKEGDLGWDILVRMELLTPFDRYIRTHKMTEEDVIKLGIDITTALDLCGQRNIIHRDVKPENIFVNDFGYFKLGDFGIAKKLESMGASHSQKGTFNYMAPEVASGTHYDARVDIYSLGIVLYRLLNNHCLPFIDETNRLNPTARKNALERRLNGEPLPAPSEASKAMANVILRACAFKPGDRFKTAADFKKALEEVKAGTYVIRKLPFAAKAAEKPVPAKTKEKPAKPVKNEKKPLIEQERNENGSTIEKTEHLEKTQAIKDRHPANKPETPADATVALAQKADARKEVSKEGSIENQKDDLKKESKKGPKKALFIVLGVLVAVALVVALIFLLKNCKPPKKNDETTAAPLETPEPIDNPTIPGLTSLEIESLPEKMLYHVGDELNTKGLTLTATFEDGSTKTITSDYEYSPKFLDASGTKEISVFYGGKEATFMVVVSPAALVSLEVRTAPNKTHYYLGQSLDLTGLTLEATYSDGAKEIITNGFESTVDVLTASGKQDVRVLFDGQKVKIQITVDEVSLSGLSIVKEPAKKSYLIGERIDTSGLKLRASYNNGEEEEIESGYTVSPEVLSKAGKQAITVMYGNQTATFNVEVSDLKIEAISIAQQPTRKFYFTGDALETAGLVLKVRYSNGKEEEVRSGFTCSPGVLNATGTQKVMVYYGEKSAAFDVSVEAPMLTAITVQTNPTKVNYVVGESLDTSGLSLTATYSNGKNEMITSGFTCSPTELDTIGTEQVTVTYQGKMATFSVTVAAVTLSSIAIASNPTKTTYSAGETLDMTGLSLIAFYNNGASETITSGFTCSPISLFSAGTTEITVTYQEKSTTFNVTVDVNVGDVITFGPYQWIILAKNGNNAMMITKDAVTKMAYNSEYTSVTWENCTLRSWLNGSFLGNFSAMDQAKIMTTTVSNPNNPNYGTAGGNSTFEKVFLLSLDEVRSCFGSDSARVCYFNGSTCKWWLRSLGYYSNVDAACVNYDGSEDKFGARVNTADYGVRPAMWVNLGS